MGITTFTAVNVKRDWPVNIFGVVVDRTLIIGSITWIGFTIAEGAN